jgi:hypothetical protein
MRRTIGSNTSVSNGLSSPISTAAVRSSPMPVSMFCFGSEVSFGLPFSSLRSYCINTRFQISSQRPQSHAGPQSGLLHPVSMRVS